MTIEDLLKLVIAGDMDAFAAGVAALDEKSRKKLFALFKNFEKAWKNRDRYAPKEEQLPEEYAYLLELLNLDKQFETDCSVKLAVLALGTLAPAKKIGMGGFNERVWPALIRVFEDRRPDWLDDWLVDQLILKANGTRAVFPVVRALVDRGLCKKPDVEGYYYVMAIALGRLRWEMALQRERPGYVLSDYLRDNPQLLEDVYPIFAVETVGFMETTDQWTVDRERGDEYWAHAIKTLAEEGLLDRGRLLGASCNALQQGFKRNLTAGIANFHETMAPTGKELEALQPGYLELLANSNEQVVAFAVRMLQKVEKANKLDDAAFADAAAPALERKGKALARGVLDLFAKIGGRTPKLIAPLSRLVAERGLQHPNADVQQAAVALLEQWRNALDGVATSAVAENVEHVAPSVRGRVEALVGEAPESHPTGAHDVPSEGLEDLITRAGALPEIWRIRAGVDEALAALEAGTLSAPLTFDIQAIPILTGLDPVAPVASLDELTTLVSQGMESDLDPMDVERILDGISRWYTASEKDFARLAPPLFAQLEASRLQRGLLTREGGPFEMERLLNHWLTGNANATRPDGEWIQFGFGKKSIMDFWNHRLSAIRERLEKGIHTPLLSLPSHTGGWLEANTLVSRWTEMEKAGIEPELYDTVQALLRLAPDGRDAAAKPAEKLQHPWAKALRWALTGKGKVQNGDESAIWLAAFRGRCPYDSADALDGFSKIAPTGPDGAVPALFTWLNEEDTRAHDIREKENALRLYRTIEEYTLDYRLRTSLGMTVQPEWKQKDHAPANLSVMLHTFSRFNDIARKAPWLVAWAATCWPANDNSVLATGVADIANTFQTRTSKLWPEYAYLTALSEPDRPWSNVTATLVALALNAPPGDLASAAIDALADAIGDGRVAPEIFGEPFARVSRTYWLQPGRIATHLQEVARVSPLHAWVVSGMLELLLRGWKDLPKNSHHILQLSLELRLQLGAPCDGALATALGAFKCSGKSAKLVKQLLSVKPGDDTALKTARMQALEARIARAERWAGA